MSLLVIVVVVLVIWALGAFAPFSPVRGDPRTHGLLVLALVVFVVLALTGNLHIRTR